MRSAIRSWSPDDVAALRQCKADNISNESIAERLGRTQNAVRAYWSYLNLTEARASAARQRREAASMGAAAAEPRRDPRVPDDVWAEREARMSAPLSVGAFVLGDPPICRSALGRKMAEQRR
jgi:hypothetical protein